MHGGNITYEKPKDEFLTLSGSTSNHVENPERTNTLIYTVKNPEFNEENSDEICNYVKQNLNVVITTLPNESNISLESDSNIVECNNGELKIEIPIILTFDRLLYNNLSGKTFKISLCIKDNIQQPLCTETLTTRIVSDANYHRFTLEFPFSKTDLNIKKAKYTNYIGNVHVEQTFSNEEGVLEIDDEFPPVRTCVLS